MEDLKSIMPSPSAVVKGETHRFTILTPALVRMEYSD